MKVNIDGVWRDETYSSNKYLTGLLGASIGTVNITYQTTSVRLYIKEGNYVVSDTVEQGSFTIPADEQWVYMALATTSAIYIDKIITLNPSQTYTVDEYQQLAGSGSKVFMRLKL